ncbi:LysR substrate-binding domain-containing protein [Kushneria phyllosphaerae]|uniref:HTH-type transcriptional regulator TsaR n=1 Tax=Kushneria phyllosphaerae TaxID=2100822 RepID=A0A2R8CNA0_9GAMM|nr:LysR substrate-binding domain-containing protein [Kushneria phyllosphaerae]SPJ34349.1 HTH-type transcriptional regulator TsaR [Kushneria phyllosphaerae]
MDPGKAEPRLHHIRAFVAVATHGSIRSAARELGMSQPAMTRAIRELETLMGAALLVRGASGVTLTDGGRAFERHARMIVSELKRARDSVDQVSGRAHGHVAIGVSATVARTILPAAVARFQKEYPQVSMHLQEGQLSALVERLRAGALDFTISTVDTGALDHDLRIQHLFDKPFVVVMRHDHPLAEATDPDRLRQTRWVLPTPRSGYYAGLYRWLDEKHIIDAQSRLECDSFTTSLNLIAQSDMVGVFAQGMVAHHGMAGLIELNLETPLPPARFYLVRHHERPLTPAAERLAQLCEYESRAG